MTQAENNDLQMNPKPFSTYDMLKEIRTLYQSHYVTENRQIVINDDSCDEVMTSDKSTIRRVIGNMLKNALEAVPDGETITLACEKDNGMFSFSVHNSSYIPEFQQLQIFKRSFSS